MQPSGANEYGCRSIPVYRLMRAFIREYVVTLFVLLTACGQHSDTAPDKSSDPVVAKPVEHLGVRGHRFIVVADVNGDDVADTLIERFVDPATRQEADKFIADAPYDSLTARIWRMKPLAFVECSDTGVGRLIIREGDSFGLAHLVNEGDLNGDGRDEIGWVGYWIDYSNVNTYHITSWNGSEWVQLASFDMWEWQLPDLPGSTREFALIGQTGLQVSDSVTSDEPPADLVWPGKHGHIHVLGMAEGADLDTLTLKLAPLRP
jgi:hypothetical protein